ncbi:PREDICTED: trans-resveratrol di-O-methyltransferase-like isoform X4 [Ipomoea nil]|uniref:trans-resveratrol di-O-methyltransferase-like isoform X4 n=1 Tax=Ipomoea nil TaxID=35883 RepID=UPI0009015810|nr:PREDICTED: trans-resveratrol di-O-methyltransferase-like isoform X4 [Ipomoea nil]
MRHLTRSGFFLHDKDDGDNGGAGGRYALAPPSCLLLKDHPFSAAPLMKVSYTIFTGPWLRVSEWFHNDDPTPFQTAHGTTFWEYATQDPELNRYFNQAMASDTLLFMSLIRKHCRGVFEGLDSLVDVGGGTGMSARAIADEFPGMKCTVLDLPHVVAGLEGTNNLTYLAGNMFEAIPPAHAVLLKSIMHDWNDEDCVKILKKCKEAISKRENGGKVIIVDVILGATQNGDDESMQNQLFMDYLMMVYYGGQERILKDWVKIFNDAGFTNYITTQLGSRSLIQLFL